MFDEDLRGDVREDGGGVFVGEGGEDLGCTGFEVEGGLGGLDAA